MHRSFDTLAKLATSAKIVTSSEQDLARRRLSQDQAQVKSESLTVSKGLSPGLVCTLISMMAITSTFLNKGINVNTSQLQHGQGVACLGT